MEISIEAVRVIDDILQGKPPLHRNVAVCGLRDPTSGNRTPPSWLELLIQRHPVCMRCNPQATRQSA